MTNFGGKLTTTSSYRSCITRMFFVNSEMVDSARKRNSIIVLNGVQQHDMLVKKVKLLKKIKISQVTHNWQDTILMLQQQRIVYCTSTCCLITYEIYYMHDLLMIQLHLTFIVLLVTYVTASRNLQRQWVFLDRVCTAHSEAHLDLCGSLKWEWKRNKILILRVIKVRHLKSRRIKFLVSLVARQYLNRHPLAW